MIHIPKKLNEILLTDQKTFSFVLNVITNLNDWLEKNNTIFFHDYTDHSIKHINSVLYSSEELISDKSWKYITSQDVAALIISVILHDSAMHITIDSFYALINDEIQPIESNFYEQNEKWSDKWIQYIIKAKRYNNEKLMSLFGNQEPIRDIPKNKLDLSEKDKIVIGDFIRINHGLLAHHFSMVGIIGHSGNSIILPKEPINGFWDLCGFIAYSHNINLRAAVDKLEKNSQQSHLNTHVPFIMILLRIADYIQIESSRAPKDLLKVNKLISPISKGEWAKHHSILDISTVIDDPEALYINAEPNDAIILEGLTKLFRNIQNELDLSWSVLGEVYGRFDPLNLLGLKIRRIKSSLDDIDEYEKIKKPPFIPKVLKFKTSEAEMMELLIAPLYGDNPEIGIRELLQNSIDACIEYDDILEKKIGQKSKSDRFVKIELEDKAKGGIICIKDNGIGMTLDIVENYFLNIGASFRKSDLWKKEHETDGHSSIHRTGRFGIGLLAAYLLGSELEVETRHFTDTTGLGFHFKCKKGCNKITLTRKSMTIGTEIRIKISNEVKSKLLSNTAEWDWFCLDYPKVIRTIKKGKEINNVDQSNLIPNCMDDLKSTNWNRLKHNNYDDIFWSYNSGLTSINNYNDHYLICNGIIITDSYRSQNFKISPILDIFSVIKPSVVVFDQDGNLTINLERTNLSDNKLPFHNYLVVEIAIYIVNKVIFKLKQLDKTTRYESINKLRSHNIEGLCSSMYSPESYLLNFILQEKRYIPLDLDLLKQNKINDLCLEYWDDDDNNTLNSNKTFNISSNYLPVFMGKKSKINKSNWVRYYFENKQWYNDHDSKGVYKLPISGKKIFIRKSDASHIVSNGYVPKTFWNRLTCEWENSKWQLLKSGSIDDYDDCKIKKIVQYLDDCNSTSLIFYNLDWNIVKNDCIESPFSKSWLNIVNSPYYQI